MICLERVNSFVVVLVSCLILAPLISCQKIDAFDTSDYTSPICMIEYTTLLQRRNSENPKEGSKSYKSIQSIAIYNNIVFGFLSGHGAYLFNLDDGNDFAYMEIPFSSHGNNAQFTDVFYNDNDEFPLLLLSRCDTTGKVSVLRISEREGNYTCSLVKDIVFDIPQMKKWGYSVCADLIRNKLIASYNKYGDWQLTYNNPVIIREFDLPNLKSSDDTTFNEVDGAVIADKPMYVIQGLTYHNGFLYQAAQLRESFYYDEYGLGNIPCIIVLDAESGLMKSIILSPLHQEPEGIAYYHDKIYLQTANQQGTGNDVVLWLHEYNLL